jgi:hypothetical protein
MAACQADSRYPQEDRRGGGGSMTMERALVLMIDMAEVTLTVAVMTSRPRGSG